MSRRYQEKSCCLPHGGPHNPPSPPPEKSCPPSGWSWHTEKACCVPHHPPPPSPPPPQCSSGWDWQPATWCCTQPPSPPKSSHHPKPSGHHGGGGYGGGWKRELPKSRSPKLCPTGLNACPIPGASGLTGDFECLDTTNELESCGGCASLGQGQDCSAIKGAWNVGCERGTCAGKQYSSHLILHDTYSSSSIHLRWWFQAFIGRQILRPSRSLNLTSPYELRCKPLLSTRTELRRLVSRLSQDFLWTPYFLTSFAVFTIHVVCVLLQLPTTVIILHYCS